MGGTLCRLASRPVRWQITRLGRPTLAALLAAPKSRREAVEGRPPSHLGMPETRGVEPVDEFHARATAEVVELDAGDDRLRHAVLGQRIRAQYEQPWRFELDDLVAGRHLLTGVAAGHRQLLTPPQP